MLFLDGSKHSIVEIPHCSVVPFVVTIVFTVLPYPAGLWNDSFSAASTSAAVIPILSASMKSCVDCKNTDRLSLSAFKQAAVAARAKAEKEHAMMAFIQLDAGQSGVGQPTA
jgi:hypothetical protein